MNEADVCGQNSCPKRDCGPFPEVQKATEVLGNLATIGTKRLVVCESNKRIQVMCLETGEWSHNETMCLGSGGCSDMVFVTRATWGARPWKGRSSITVPVSSLIIHHTENVSCTVKTQCMEILREIQNQHMDKYRWYDIGYNFLVGEDGNVYEGRGWKHEGASEHSTGNTTKSTLTQTSILVSMIGNFEPRVPNAIALTALKNLIKCGVQQGNITESYRLYGHRNETNTSCPGTALYDYIQTLQPHSP
ncbi:hypothetical protein DPMN_009175 [Dreissena polymorpha]|uniref:Uncharacterized protein n=1 Tax=Dreissena polymorpha TaxID=45954 RepID=A0A9D4N0R9_DREPO|nr:hypothetical protein DPMN_009175 [Dreissena polymorpha]